MTLVRLSTTRTGCPPISEPDLDSAARAPALVGNATNAYRAPLCGSEHRRQSATGPHASNAAATSRSVAETGTSRTCTVCRPAAARDSGPGRASAGAATRYPDARPCM